METMTINCRNWVMECARKVDKSFHHHPLYHLEFYSPITCFARRLEHEALTRKEMFQEPIHAPLTICVDRII